MFKVQVDSQDYTDYSYIYLFISQKGLEIIVKALGMEFTELLRMDFLSPHSHLDI